jgi:hypothetical protein
MRKGWGSERCFRNPTQANSRLEWATRPQSFEPSSFPMIAARSAEHRKASFRTLIREKYSMKKSSPVGLVLVVGCLLMSVSAWADDTNCSGPEVMHDYVKQPGDLLQPRQVDLARPFTGNGKLEVNVCHGNLRVRSQADAKELKLQIQTDAQPDGHGAGDFIQVFHIDPEKGLIHLKFPAEAHATVTLIVPMGASSNDEFNLGMGNLDFDAIGAAGRREINVGMGNMKLLVDGDKSYSSMEVNVGMGSLHDHRPGGRNGYFAVSRDFTGSGSGSMEINVGMGSLDIRQE